MGNIIRYTNAIRESGLDIYSQIEIGDPKLWIPSPILEELLDNTLRGNSLARLPLRTRSKVLKEQVCQALGYPTPTSFKKTKPRFPGQDFDTYIQKSNNLQVWNEELSPTRRYVLIRLNEQDIITRVKVVTGNRLASLDKTGTLTQKYQARIMPTETKSELITTEDTQRLKPYTHSEIDLSSDSSPIDNPNAYHILPISVVYKKLQTLIGTKFNAIGFDQERNRGASLHRLICQKLGYHIYKDDGQYPDIKNQLLEVKLQTSPTIDLGLVCPNSNEKLDLPKLNGDHIRYCDVRYAIFFAKNDGKRVTLTHLYLVTGEHFFDRFPQFQGKLLNRKLQIPLPSDFFNS